MRSSEHHGAATVYPVLWHILNVMDVTPRLPRPGAATGRSVVVKESEAPAEAKAMLTRVYDAFNRRDIEAVLADMHPDVEWPNGMEGGYEHGHDAVRQYWTRQWSMIDPSVTPAAFGQEPDGRIAVSVRQVIRNLAGEVIADRDVEHVYRLRDGLIEHMEIRQEEP